jgi:hypothetical protein
MKKRFLFSAVCLAGMAVLLILSGCDNTTGGGKSTDATLESLTLSGGATLNETFSSATTDYTVSVENTVTSLTVTGTANHAAATLDPANGVVAKALIVGSKNVFTITVTAEDGTTARTYTVTVTRAATGDESEDATLASLTLSGEATLNETFSAATTDYTVSVGNTVTSLTVTGTANHAAATLDPANGVVTKALTVGSNNVFAITVTAEDGTTTKTYKVTVTRAASTDKSSDATLKSLTLSGEATLNETFNSATTEYTVSVWNTVANLTVTGVKNHAAATLNPANGVVTKDLSVGSNNVFTIAVTAENGTTVKTYTVTVTRDSGIRTIVLNPPDFSDPAATELSGDPITLYKTGGTAQTTLTVTGTYASCQWLVDGAVRGTADSLTLKASDYSPGAHFLTLEVVKDTVLYSKELVFTVVGANP